ncbi:MAG: hypothetical protein IJ882_03040 [Paludibacteraceae bacterium]|nr:hypothetical protein [Paludibacteraceae bacterium]
MFEDLNSHRASVTENIQKGFEIGFTPETNSVSKAHKESDIHPNGKWIWTRLPSGKYDWRVIKKTTASPSAPVQAGAEPAKPQPAFTREELHGDYKKAEWADNAEKKQLAAKYGLSSLKKGDIQKEILVQLRNVRKTATSFDTDDIRDFFHQEPGVLKIKDYLKEEGIEFVKYLKEEELEYLKKHKLDKWIGFPISNNMYGISYADKDALKRYVKIVEYLDEAVPRPRTFKDVEYDTLVRKFTELLADYKKEYIERVKDYARQRYNVTLLDRLKDLREKYKDLYEESKGLDWRTDKEAYEENRKARVKLSNKIDAIDKFFHKYTNLTFYIADCVKNAKEEFEDNIKTLSSRIMKEELDTTKLVVKSVHDDPKVFNMKITDGTKNLYCRSVLAAMFSTYMIPHYRFIITNRKDG